MFQSPLKTVTEKLKPTQSKSSISSLKFERPSDFKKFIGFIKNETQELEKIKLPTRAEIKPKSKSGGVGGLLALGLFGGLGAAFGGGEGKDEENLRVGSAGGTASQYSSGLGIATKGIKNTKNLTKVKTTVKTEEQVKNERKLNLKKAKERLDKKKKRGSGFFSTKKQKKEAAKAIQTSAKLENYKKMLNRYSALMTKEITELRGAKSEAMKAGLDLTQQSVGEMEQMILSDPNLTTNGVELKNLRKQIKNWEASNSEIYYTYVMSGEERLLQAISDAETIKKSRETLKTLSKKERDKLAREYRFFRKQQRVPNFKIGGFSIKDSLDKTFKFAGKNTKGFREGLMKNVGKIKIPGSGLVTKGIVKGFMPLDVGLTAFTGPFDVGILENRGGFFNPKIRMDRTNILTHLYDAFTRMYNAGVEGLGFSDAFKRLLISKPIDMEISGSVIPFTNIGAYGGNLRTSYDAYNKKILEARRLKKIYNFDTAMVNNPNIQLPKSNIFAFQKSDGAEFAIPFDYSNSGIFDYNAATRIKLFKQ